MMPLLLTQSSICKILLWVLAIISVKIESFRKLKWMLIPWIKSIRRGMCWGIVIAYYNFYGYKRKNFRIPSCLFRVKLLWLMKVWSNWHTDIVYSEVDLTYPVTNLQRKIWVTRLFDLSRILTYSRLPNWDIVYLT